MSAESGCTLVVNTYVTLVDICGVEETVVVLFE